MHLVLLLVGLGSVENCRLFLAANLWQTSSMLCMPSLQHSDHHRIKMLPYTHLPPGIQYPMPSAPCSKQTNIYKCKETRFRTTPVHSSILLLIHKEDHSYNNGWHCKQDVELSHEKALKQDCIEISG